MYIVYNIHNNNVHFISHCCGSHDYHIPLKSRKPSVTFLNPLCIVRKLVSIAFLNLLVVLSYLQFTLYPI